MSLNDQIIRQRDFSGGEADPDALRRDDMDLLKFCVRRARNMVSTHTGALTHRPGRRMLFEDDGVIAEFKPFDDVTYRVIFSAGRVRIRSESGALVADLVAPWGADDVDSLVFENMDNEIFVTWAGPVQVITVKESTLVWSIAAFSFGTGIDNTRMAPFYRFPGTSDITMRVSDYTGSVAVTFSAAVLTANHIGTAFRYAGRQLRITAVSSSKVGTATVLEDLPSTYSLDVDSAIGFSVGQIVECDTTNVKGEIISIVGDVIKIVAFNTLTKPLSTEKLVGPNASTEIDIVTVETSPSPTIQWDEQFFGAHRGYPRSVAKDRQRLIFSNFPQFKSAILWSATGNNRDFLIGTDADDAIFEYISAECQVFHVVGGYDEFVITDKGIFYVPISVGTPLQPGSVEFRPIFSQELANIRPIEVTEGLIFVDKARNGVYAITATGQTARPYVASEINRYHRHLFEDVVSIAVTSGTKNFPTRQIYAVNDDGTVVVGQFNPDRDTIGWLKWDGGGSVKSASGSYGNMLFVTSYTFGASVVTVAEQLDYDLFFDCAMTLGTADQIDFLALADGSPLKLGSGENLSLSNFVASFYADKLVHVYGDGFYLGTTTADEDGIVSGFSAYSEITIGVKFDWLFQPLFTRVEDGNPVGQGEKRRKIENMTITVRGTQEFQCGNRIFGSYRGGEDMSLPVPTRDDTYRYREAGRSWDPIVEFKSTFPGSFKLVELATRITV